MPVYGEGQTPTNVNDETTVKPELGTRYLKSSGAAAYRYSNKKVAPLPLLACKTVSAAATFKK